VTWLRAHWKVSIIAFFAFVIGFGVASEDYQSDVRAYRSEVEAELRRDVAEDPPEVTVAKEITRVETTTTSVPQAAESTAETTDSASDETEPNESSLPLDELVVRALERDQTYESVGGPEETLCSPSPEDERRFICHLEYARPVGGLTTQRSRSHTLIVTVDEEWEMYEVKGDPFGPYDLVD
jgi:hypothetical protein